MFNPNEVVKVVTVQVAGDTDDEPDEAFSLVLSEASCARVADARATVVIARNDIPIGH